MMRDGLKWLPWPLLAVLLAGCGAGEDDLHQWAVDQRRQAVPRVTPVSEPKRYVPLPYTESDAADPFGPERLTRFLQRDASGQGEALIAGERHRRKEPLEDFPLDTMVMVGSLRHGGQRVALLKVDKLLYQVRAGNHLGQNYGMVTQVSENDVTLREIVQDAAGEWVERMTSLQLQENTK